MKKIFCLSLVALSALSISNLSFAQHENGDSLPSYVGFTQQALADANLQKTLKRSLSLQDYNNFYNHFSDTDNISYPYGILGLKNRSFERRSFERASVENNGQKQARLVA
ncbi:hypothetical protein MOMA_07676 [Moraxella macacae 0408225]|uniref:Uncharacterized protein n=1 Tax=Moraxella macacae 0408225 TaxID=1230338 RepID=L2F7I6_9GAMM|nr:hypothetical protein [Moraxella macacae]ELA08423.1 hypothetical protein MOMA_07676 [Moraxella macacae 0408225]